MAAEQQRQAYSTPVPSGTWSNSFCALHSPHQVVSDAIGSAPTFVCSFMQVSVTRSTDDVREARRARDTDRCLASGEDRR